MSYFAEIDSSGFVKRVVVSEKPFIDEGKLGDTSSWIEVNNDYHGVGYKYDSELNYFIPPCPYKSWTFNRKTLTYDPPVEKPADKDGVYQYWDEATLSWLATSDK